MSSGDLSDLACVLGLWQQKKTSTPLHHCHGHVTWRTSCPAHPPDPGTTEPAQCQIHIPACHTLSTCPHKAPESHNTHPILQPAGWSQLFQSQMQPLHETQRFWVPWWHQPDVIHPVIHERCSHKNLGNIQDQAGPSTNQDTAHLWRVQGQSWLNIHRPKQRSHTAWQKLTTLWQGTNSVDKLIHQFKVYHNWPGHITCNCLEPWMQTHSPHKSSKK